MSFRNWCFTINNATEEDITFDESCMRYLVFQIERGDQGTEHIQGYVEFSRKCRLRFAKQHIHNNAHLERRRGTREQARDYCKKEETRLRGPFEYGEWILDGQRTDLSQLLDGVREGKTDLALFEDQPEGFARHYRAIRNVRSLLLSQQAKMWRTVTVTIFYGHTGTGKTRSVFDEHGYDNVFVKDQSMGDWWDGYHGQDILLIDDFYGWIKYGTLLRILDGHPLHLNVKHSDSWALWTKVYITSNHHPSRWYQQGLSPALIRRISICINFCDDGTREPVSLT